MTCVCCWSCCVYSKTHLWGCPHPGNVWRFITYWYTPSLNTPPKTPTVHCWLMNCTARSSWIIFLKRIFLPFFHFPFLWFHILCQIDKVCCVQPNKVFPLHSHVFLSFFLSTRERGCDIMVDVLQFLKGLPFIVLFWLFSSFMTRLIHFIFIYIIPNHNLSHLHAYSTIPIE